MDYVYVVLFILVMVLLLVGLNKLDAKTKKKHKQTAYKLLEDGNADNKKVKDTIKCLRLYGGRWKKDKECVQLVERLQDKLGDEMKLNV
jgi:hypothetical protein